MNVDEWNAHADATNKKWAKLSGNQPEDFDRLTPDEQRILCDWIKANFVMRKTINHNQTTYQWKHRFEYKNFYITNGQMKGALVKCGFKTSPVDEGINWCVNISELSMKRLEAIEGRR